MASHLPLFVGVDDRWIELRFILRGRDHALPICERNIHGGEKDYLRPSFWKGLFESG